MTAGRALRHLVLCSPQPGTQYKEEQLLTSHRDLHRRGPMARTARIHLRRIGSSTGGDDRLGKTRRFGVPLPVVLALAVSATLLVG
jgi:hypothetical protein